jgi:hypothetical protein
LSQILGTQHSLYSSLLADQLPWDIMLALYPANWRGSRGGSALSVSIIAEWRVEALPP